jgi:hypothetical protein
MGLLLLLLLSCASNLLTDEYPLIYVTHTPPTPTIAIGPPQQKASWQSVPSVRVCAASEVPLYRVVQVLRYWGDLGYSFGETTKDPLSTCMNPRDGEIIITLPEPGFSDKHLASTRIYTDKHSGYIVRAKIHVLPKSAKKERVLEHEMGHALGWYHYPQKFHIMHPHWRLGGYERHGLKKQDGPLR